MAHSSALVAERGLIDRVPQNWLTSVACDAILLLEYIHGLIFLPQAFDNFPDFSIIHSIIQDLDK